MDAWMQLIEDCNQMAEWPDDVLTFFIRHV